MTHTTHQNRMPRAVNLLAVLTLIGAAFIPGGFGAAYAEDAPSPWLRAFPDDDFVDGSYWPANQPVSLEINDLVFDSTADSNGRVEFVLTGHDLKQGDMLTMRSGEITVVHTVKQLFVTAIDLTAQTVAGTVDGQEVVHVWTGGAELYVDSDEYGKWLANLSGSGDPVLFPGACGNAEAWGEGASSTIVDWCVPAPSPVPWRDEFDGSLGEGWHWVNENSDRWNLTEQPGFLRIYNVPFGTGGENLLLRSVAQGDFMIETRLLFEPDANFQFAGLVIWQDENNFLQLGRAFCDVPNVCVGNGIYFDKILAGNFTDSNFATPVDNPSEAYLRLERRGDMVKAFFSYEGITWFEIGTHWIPSDFQVNGVGLTASQDSNTPDWDIPADFDFFELTEGWGFLPEGFHDFDQGDVPSWGCNAGGWAADPDDRATDLAVEIDVDGVALPDWVYAGEYRQDLADAGVCVDGNCSFSTSLWGTISAYEPHSVVAYAQDIPSGEWVQLSNSPKTLTCRTYDIYSYDPQTGETRQITNLRDTDEYNPSWSPSGKKVAHDVVNADGSQGIYITDVKTGVSTPLAGAEDGGNDAVWSPNGRWIAFDRALTETPPNLYVVPATGGTPTLVRSDAVSADWAPSGKRLVFQQPSDGSIRTVAVDGGGGAETSIAASGANPAWSPDGNWIAYEDNGDIWKVQVNVQGTKFGEPIRVTNLVAGEGQPTWPADSQTIVFHAGLSRDYDLWTVPAAGGVPTWLTGAPEFGDYDPAYVKNSSTIAYASFSPEGQAARQWGAAFTYDYGTWTEGVHSYYFEDTYSVPEPGGETTPVIPFSVSDDAPQYDGYVLLRGLALRAFVDGACPAIDPVLHPDQNTRFHYGWMTGPMTYEEALTHFDSMTVKAYWNDGMSAVLGRHEIFPWTSQVDWLAYVCTYTR
jgi:Tol biopolymer transport system component/regulation of enolase protein 1 (concanavalin A-like superfamily)